VTVGNVHTYRNPLYAQTDFKFDQEYKLSGSKTLSFGATFTNLFNERAVTAVNEQADSNSGYINGGQALLINGQSIGGGTAWYAAAMNPYNVASLVQANPGSYSSTGTYNAPQTISALYGKPYKYQEPRTLRLDVHFTF
jgi:dienelactone hydrolase